MYFCVKVSVCLLYNDPEYCDIYLYIYNVVFCWPRDLDS